MARSVTARQRIGTVAVTSVGMFAGGAASALRLTLVIDHTVVDGAPATRFAAEFRELPESAAVISPD